MKVARLAKGADEALTAASDAEKVVTATNDAEQAISDSGDIVYRALHSGENPERGLFPKNPDKPQSVLTHVRNASNPKYPGDQFISTTKDPNVAIVKYAKGDTSRVVEIDLSKVEGTVTDLSTNEGMLAAGIKWPNPAYYWAMADKEVLIEGFVPPEAVRPYIRP